MSKTIKTSDGNVYINQVTLATNDATGTFMIIPHGDMLNRPGAVAEGALRYNTAVHAPEWFDGFNWQEISSTGQIASLGASSTPASASATGTAGQIKWDSDFIYVCVATNTWKRAPIGTW